MLTSSVLARPGHADEQAVAAAEQGHEQLLDDLVLADDDLADLVLELPVGGGEVADGFGFRAGGGTHRLSSRPGVTPPFYASDGGCNDA